MNSSIIIIISILTIISAVFFIAFIFILFSKNRKKIINKAEKEAEELIKITKNNVKNEKLLMLEEQKKYKNKIQKELIENEEFLNTRNKNLIEREIILDKLEKRNVEKQKSIIEKIEKLNKELESITQMSIADAKSKILNNLEYELKKELNEKVLEYKKKLNSKSKQIAQNILANAIEKYAPLVSADKTISILKIKDNEIKGRIIGKEGRNIRIFEKYTGVDLLINETPGIIRISCFNSKRREIAKLTLSKLIENGKFQIQKIEKYLNVAKKEFNDKVIETGEKLVQQLNLDNVDPKMYEYLGLLKYRTSYGQNVLEHSIEVGKTCAIMADELGLNSAIALRAGLLHDIGKSIDQDFDESHVFTGLKIAKKCNESNFVINAIESHHGDVEPNSVYSVLVSAADTLSAARPGARNNTIDNFINRMVQIEKICSSLEGVTQSYAFQSGREIKIIVDSKKIDDFEIHKISKKIKEKILESDLIIAGDISITVIRETTSVEKFTKKNTEV